MASALSLPMMWPAAGLGLRQHDSPPCHGLSLTSLQRSRLRAAPAATLSCSASRLGNYGGVLVDEDMAVLRRRIREARMADYKTPPGWAAWENFCYPAYVSDVSSARAGTLQLMAKGTKPGVAVAVATLVFAGVPVSAAVALNLLGQAAGAILQHVC